MYDQQLQQALARRQTQSCLPPLIDSLKSFNPPVQSVEDPRCQLVLKIVSAMGVVQKGSTLLSDPKANAEFFAQVDAAMQASNTYRSAERAIHGDPKIYINSAISELAARLLFVAEQELLRQDRSLPGAGVQALPLDSDPAEADVGQQALVRTGDEPRAPKKKRDHLELANHALTFSAERIAVEAGNFAVVKQIRDAMIESTAVHNLSSRGLFAGGCEYETEGAMSLMAAIYADYRDGRLWPKDITSRYGQVFGPFLSALGLTAQAGEYELAQHLEAHMGEQQAKMPKLPPPPSELEN